MILSTVAAISTPTAPGGIAIIRISGDDSISIAEKIFKPYKSEKISRMAGYTCAYGAVYDDKEKIDDCVLTLFRAPHSYTGEDVVEISCHGGLFVTRKILRLVIKNGAMNAPAGEFTKRAFLNGKIDLTRAESIMDIISAKGEKELKMAEDLKSGSVFRQAQKASDILLETLSFLSVWSDYPDDDISEISPEKLVSSLRSARSLLHEIIKDYDKGQIIKYGISTVIAGRPNVGKSSLFNCLSGYERSIVTDIAGTTRDVVEENITVGDITLRISDTAGIRDTEDIIEEKGVEITQKYLDAADLVLCVFDGSCPLTEDDLKFMNMTKNKNRIAVINKNDLRPEIDRKIIDQNFGQVVSLSAKEKSGLDGLEKAIEEIFCLDEIKFDSAVAANERQKNCIELAEKSIDEAIEAILSGEFYDAVTVLIDDAEQHLLELTGEKITDRVVDEIFSRFCVGK